MVIAVGARSVVAVGEIVAQTESAVSLDLNEAKSVATAHASVVRRSHMASFVWQGQKTRGQVSSAALVVDLVDDKVLSSGPRLDPNDCLPFQFIWLDGLGDTLHKADVLLGGHRLCIGVVSLLLLQRRREIRLLLLHSLR